MFSRGCTSKLIRGNNIQYCYLAKTTTKQLQIIEKQKQKQKTTTPSPPPLLSPLPPAQKKAYPTAVAWTTTISVWRVVIKGPDQKESLVRSFSVSTFHQTVFSVTTSPYRVHAVPGPDTMWPNSGTNDWRQVDWRHWLKFNKSLPGKGLHGRLSQTGKQAFS